MVRGLRSRWGTTPKGLMRRLAVSKTKRAGSKTHCPFSVMCTNSSLRKSTWSISEAWGPLFRASIFLASDQGSFFVTTGAPVR
jgi:hypothetical protein